MAPINKSGRVSPNTIFSEKTEHIGSRYRQETVSEFDVKDRIIDLEQQLAELEELQAKAPTNLADITKKIANVERTLEAARSRQTHLKLSRGIIMTRGLESLTSEMMSSQGIEREAAFAAGEDPNMIGAQGMAMTRATSPGESQVSIKQRLIKEQQDIRSQIKQNATEYESASKKYIETTDPEKQKEFAAERTAILERRRGLASKLAVTESGLSYIGADEKTLMNVQMSAVQSVAQRQRQEEARQYVGDLTPIELKRRERSLQESVAKKFEEVGSLTTQHQQLKEKSDKSGETKEIKETTEAHNKLQDAIKSLTESTEELQKVQTAASAAGGGRGLLKGLMSGDPGALQMAGTALKTVGQIGLIGADVYQTLGVTRPNMMIENQTRAAGISNQLFDMRRAALSGDMTALTLLSSGAIQRASESAEDRRSRMMKIGGIRVASKGAMALGEGLQLAGGTIDAMEEAAVSSTGGAVTEGAKGFFKGGPAGAVKGAIGAAVKGAAKGLSYPLTDPRGSAQLVNTVGYTADAVKEAALMSPTAQQESLNEFQRQLELDKQLSYVTGQQRQVAYDYFKGNINTSRSLGVSGSDKFLSQMSEQYQESPTGKFVNVNLEKLSEFGVSTEEFNKLSAYGAAEMGGRFDTKQVLGAVNLQHLGLGTAQEHMQRQALMAQAGANNPQASYASVLETAVTKGLDSSKNLNVIAQATAQSAQSSVAYRVGGLDITGQVGKELMSRVDVNSVNKDSDLMRAASNKERLDAVMTDTSATIAGAILVGGVGVASGAKQLGTQTALTKLNTDSISAIIEEAKAAKDDPNKKRDMSAKMRLSYGLGEFVDASGNVNIEGLEKARKYKLEYAAGGGAYGLSLGVQSDPRFKEYLEAEKKYGKTEAALKYPDIANKIGQAQILSGTAFSEIGAQLSNEDKLVNEQGKKIGEAARGEKAVDTSTLSKEKKMAADLDKTQAQVSTQMAQDAAKSMGGFNSLIEGISTASQDWLKKGGQDFAKAAGLAAADFTKGTAVFSTGLNDLGKAMSEAAESVRKGKWPPPDDKNKKQ